MKKYKDGKNLFLSIEEGVIYSSLSEILFLKMSSFISAKNFCVKLRNEKNQFKIILRILSDFGETDLRGEY